MLGVRVLTTIWSELRSRVAGVGGKTHGVQSSDLPAGGTLQMLFPASPSRAYSWYSLYNLAANCPCTSLAPQPQVPGPLSLSFLFLTVLPLVSPTSGLPTQHPGLPGWLEAAPQSFRPLPSPDLPRHPSTPDLPRLSRTRLPRTANHPYLRAPATASRGGALRW